MLRRLILLRHTKSDWESGADTDHARPLNARGRRDAPRVAAKLVELGWLPAVVISSDAVRTRETWALMKDAFDGVEAAFTEDLYLGDLAAIRTAAAAVGPTARCLMLIGHNPGWEDAASTLAQRGVSLTTCNAAMLTVEADTWVAAFDDVDAWQLEQVVRPKELGTPRS